MYTVMYTRVIAYWLYIHFRSLQPNNYAQFVLAITNLFVYYVSNTFHFFVEAHLQPCRLTFTSKLPYHYNKDFL